MLGEGYLSSPRRPLSTTSVGIGECLLDLKARRADEHESTGLPFDQGPTPTAIGSTTSPRGLLSPPTPIALRFRSPRLIWRLGQS